VTRRALRLSFAAALVLLAGAGATVAAADGPSARTSLLPTITPATRGEHCIADPQYMRRHHMDMLFHQRTETVHLGIRGAPASLRGCVDCHASTQTGSVAEAKTDFCVSCHSYAAVKIDCFGCHSSKAEPVADSPANARMEVKRP